MGFLFILVIAYAPMFYQINKRLRKLEEENQELKNELKTLKQNL